MKERSFRIYIQRLLKISYPDFRIGKVALNVIDDILKIFSRDITRKSITLTLGSDKRTITVKDLESSLRILIPNEIDVCKKIIEFADHSCEEYQNALLEQSIDKEKGKQSDVKSSTRESRAHLIFSVSTTEKYLRCFGQNNLHVSAQAPIFLAAVNEYITNAILELAQKYTTLAKKSTIQIRHIFLGVSEDRVLYELFQRLNIIFLGVNSEARDSLEDLRRKNDAKHIPPQLLMQHAPFNRLVREIGKIYFDEKDDAKEPRYTRKFMICMQFLIEERMIRLMRGAVQICEHDKRDTVYARDISLAMNFMDPLIVLTHENSDTRIAEAAIRKMALRAGTKRFGEDCTDIYRQIFLGLMHEYIHSMIVSLNLRELRTVSVKHLAEVAGLKNQHILVVTNIPKKRKRKNSSSASDTESVAESVGSDANSEENSESESEDEETLSTQLDDISETQEEENDEE